MFGMFPFNNSNNGWNNWNVNGINSFFNLFDDGFINSMVDNLLDSNLVNDMLDEMINSEDYDVQFKDYGDYYLIKGYLPGIGPRDVSIDFEKNKAILTIKKKKVYSDGQNFSMMVVQSGGDLVKTFYIGEVDVSKLRATFDNDLLLLTIPKIKKSEDNNDISDEPTIIDVNNYKVE